MNTLATPNDYAAIQRRIESLTEADRGLWGRMSVQGMVCHLTDAFRLPLGERTAERAPGIVWRSGFKWIALRLPMQWPKGVKTRPEMEQGVGGTVPKDFAVDREELLAVLERFTVPCSTHRPAHPIFGRMTEAEWMRWGYLHTDHHLRQFGR